MHPKKKCPNYFNICLKKVILEEEKINFEHSLVFCWLLLSSSSLPHKQFHSKFIITTLLLHGPLPFHTRAPILPLSHHKTRWTISVDNACLRNMSFGTSNSMVNLTFFSLVLPNCSHNELNNQSQFSQRLEMISWSMV
jgi:hypothetical protein